MSDINKLLDEFEHECFMLRVEATETRAKNDVVRTAYERIRDEFAERIIATLGMPEIVRCRDCEHYDPHCTDDGVCFLPDGDGDFARWEVKPDGFCSWAERRDE